MAFWSKDALHVALSADKTATTWCLYWMSIVILSHTYANLSMQFGYFAFLFFFLQELIVVYVLQCHQKVSMWFFATFLFFLSFSYVVNIFLLFPSTHKSLKWLKEIRSPLKEKRMFLIKMRRLLTSFWARLGLTSSVKDGFVSIAWSFLEGDLSNLLVLFRGWRREMQVMFHHQERLIVIVIP